MVYVTDEGDFVYLSVKESLMCFDTAYGKYIGKYGLTCCIAAVQISILIVYI